MSIFWLKYCPQNYIVHIQTQLTLDTKCAVTENGSTLPSPLWHKSHVLSWKKWISTVWRIKSQISQSVLLIKEKKKKENKHTASRWLAHQATAADTVYSLCCWGLLLLWMSNRGSWEQRPTKEWLVGESHDTSADRMRPCGAVTVTVQSYTLYTVPQQRQAGSASWHLSLILPHMARGHKEDQCLICQYSIYTT